VAQEIRDVAVYDVAVIGSGPAGYSAAVCAAREGLKTVLFQGFESGGQPMLAAWVEGYPGVEEGVSGPELMARFGEQADSSGAETRPDNVWRVDLSERPFRLWAEGEEEPVLARSVIAATGGRVRRLGVPGELRLMGKGVSTCATCDGFLFRDKRVAVVGGGDVAMHEALFLTRYASEVLVIHRRDAFRASKIMVDRARNNPKVTFVLDSVVEEILGEHSVGGGRAKNVKTGEARDIKVDGFFVAVGADPASGLFGGHLELDGDGYVVRKEGTTTSVPGVFAVGEVSDKRYRKIATAVGDGCRAALDAKGWLETRG